VAAFAAAVGEAGALQVGDQFSNLRGHEAVVKFGIANVRGQARWA
jgi:hypothetical protein